MKKGDVVSLVMVGGGVVGGLAAWSRIGNLKELPKWTLAYIVAEMPTSFWWYLVLAGCLVVVAWGGYRLWQRKSGWF